MADRLIPLADPLIRFLVAFARLRWRIFVNSVRDLPERGADERLVRLSDPLALTAMTVSAIAIVPLASVGAAVAGWALADRQFALEYNLVFFRMTLLYFVVAPFLAPLLLGGRAGLPVASRLLLLPIERRWLHLLRYLSGLTELWLVFAAGPVLAFPLGLLAGGEPRAAAASLTAGVLMLLAFNGLGTGAASIVALVLRDRRRSDLLILTLALVLAAVALSPYLFLNLEEPLEVSGALWRLNVPAELYLLAWSAALDGALGKAALAACALAAMAAGTYALAALAHRRLLTTAATDPGTVKRRGPAPRRWLCSALPGLPAAASAVAGVQLRTLLRTVTGKTAMIQAPLMVVICGLALSRVWPGEWIDEWRMVCPLQLVLLWLGAYFAALALVPLAFNQFAIDRSGLALACLLPLDPRHLVYGKAAAWGLFAAVSWGSAIGPALLFGWISWPVAIHSVMIAATSTLALYLLLAPIAAVVSARLPKAADPTRLEKTQPHNLAQLVALLSVSAAWISPVTLVVTSLLWRSHAVAWLLLLAWLGGTGLLARWLMPLAVEVWKQRREAVLLAVREGRSG